jgi:hypothetical protein
MVKVFINRETQVFQRRGRSFRLLSLSTALLLVWVLPVSGQGALPDQLGRLNHNSRVRVTLLDGRALTGQFVGIGDGRLGVRAESGRTDTLSLGDVRTLAVRGRHTKTGAIVGGSAGLATGIFVGWLVGALCDAAVCDRAGPFLVTIPLFTGGGSLLGAVIGAAVPKWKQVFP